eukprot:1159586-Pelagomonas_calceolata.AAC.14
MLCCKSRSNTAPSWTQAVGKEAGQEKNKKRKKNLSPPYGHLQEEKQKILITSYFLLCKTTWASIFNFVVPLAVGHKKSCVSCLECGYDVHQVGKLCWEKRCSGAASAIPFGVPLCCSLWQRLYLTPSRFNLAEGALSTILKLALRMLFISCRSCWNSAVGTVKQTEQPNYLAEAAYTVPSSFLSLKVLFMRTAALDRYTLWSTSSSDEVPKKDGCQDACSDPPADVFHSFAFKYILGQTSSIGVKTA